MILLVELREKRFVHGQQKLPKDIVLRVGFSFLLKLRVFLFFFPFFYSSSKVKALFSSLNLFSSFLAENRKMFVCARLSWGKNKKRRDFERDAAIFLALYSPLKADDIMQVHAFNNN